MLRETLTTILESAAGLKKDRDRFRASEEHHIAFYLGEPGNAMVIGNIHSVALKDDYVEIDARGKGVFYVSYDAVHAVSERPVEGVRSSSTGVGFE